MLYAKQILKLCVVSLLLILLPSCNPFETSKEQKHSAEIQTQGHGAVKEIETEEEFTSLLASGKPVIAKFWATWCPPCQRMKPIFAAISNNYPDKAHFVSLENGNKNLGKLFDEHVKQGFPTFVYFDKNGKVIETHPGGYSQDELDKAVSEFIQKHS